MDPTKNNKKRNAIKLTFLLVGVCFGDQSAEEPFIIPVRRYSKEWQQKRVFSEFQMFIHEKLTKENLKVWQESNIPLDLQIGQDSHFLMET